MSRWKRNIIVLCFAQLFTMLGFGAYFPFIPYYMQDLGAANYEEAMSWFAAFQTSGAIAMMVASPVWGRLADRYGRKPMLVRATSAGAILAFTLTLARSPMQLVLVRALQGIFCGTVSASITMVATETPEEHLGMGLGVMQTAQFVGQAIGPLVGGLAADSFGYRAVFPMSSVLMIVALGSIVLLVKERFRPPERQPGPFRLRLGREALSSFMKRSTVVLLITLGSIRFGAAVLGPILSLYVKSLSPGSTHLATLAGSVVSVSAFTSSAAALGIGHLGDRVGQKLLLIACCIGVALTYVPQAFVSSVWQLLALRALQGAFLGGTIPTATALLARSIEPSKRGTVFGLANSVQAGARAAGPVIGAGVANAWGLSSVFLVTGGVFAIISAMVGALVGAPGRIAATSGPASISASKRAREPASPCS